MNPTFSADALWGGRCHRPDRLLDARGRNISEAGVVPLDQPVTRMMPTIRRPHSRGCLRLRRHFRFRFAL
jgi:hypothetical protein